MEVTSLASPSRAAQSAPHHRELLSAAAAYYGAAQKWKVSALPPPSKPGVSVPTPLASRGLAAPSKLVAALSAATITTKQHKSASVLLVSSLLSGGCRGSAGRLSCPGSAGRLSCPGSAGRLSAAAPVKPAVLAPQRCESARRDGAEALKRPRKTCRPLRGPANRDERDDGGRQLSGVGKVRPPEAQSCTAQVNR
eukprot:365114-Chlamydomonas_euryale.AAC.4